MGLTKTIEIDGKQVPFKASAAIPRIYRIKFHRDVYKDLAALEKAVGKNVEENSNLDSSHLRCLKISLISWLNTQIRLFPIHLRSGLIISTPFQFIRYCRRLSNFGVLMFRRMFSLKKTSRN